MMFFPENALESLITVWNSSTLNKIPFLLAAFFWGSCWGSFIQASSYRIPRSISLVYPGSRCPKCNHNLGLMDNLPLVGWLLLKGQCRYCQVSIPGRYLVVEIMTALLHLPAMFFAMNSEQPLASFLLVSLIISWAILLTLIDSEHRVLPDILTLGPLFFLILTQTDWKGQPLDNPMMGFFFLAIILLIPQAILDLLRSLVGTLGGFKAENSFIAFLSFSLNEGETIRPIYTFFMAIPFLVLSAWFFPNLSETFQQGHWYGLGIALAIMLGAERLSLWILKSPGLGLGDVKLGALLGWVLGWPAFLITLGTACSTTLSVGILKGVHRQKDTSLPFGPALIWSGLVVFLIQLNL